MQSPPALSLRRQCLLLLAGRRDADCDAATLRRLLTRVRLRRHRQTARLPPSARSCSPGGCSGTGTSSSGSSTTRVSSSRICRPLLLSCLLRLPLPHRCCRCAPLPATERTWRPPSPLTGATAGPGTAAFILRLLSVLQSWGAWRDGRLVGWAVRQAYGAIGMLHVLEEERGRGVGRQLLAFRRHHDVRGEAEGLGNSSAAAAAGVSHSEHGSERCDDFTPFCFINDWNDVSQRLFAAVGFRPVLQVDWLTWKPTAALHPQ